MEISKISWKEDPHLKCEVSLDSTTMGRLTLIVIDDAGNEFEITAPDYSFNCCSASGNIGRSGDKITYVGRTTIGYNCNKVRQIGNIIIQYNGEKVVAVGRTNISYNSNKLRQVGNVIIQYNGEKVVAVGRTQISYTGSRIIGIRGDVK